MFSSYTTVISTFVRQNIRLVVPLALLFLACIVLGIYLLFRPQTNFKNLSDYSSISDDDTTDTFVLHKDDGFLFKTNSKGKDAALDFLESDPTYNGRPLFPDNFSEQSELSDEQADANDPFLLDRGITSNKEHYYFTQQIGGVPIYGVRVAVHIKNGNEVYEVSGNPVFRKDVTEKNISVDRAKQIAVAAAEQDVTDTEFLVEEAVESILNKKAIGVDEDDTNYATAIVVVSATNILFRKEYFVDLSTGSVIFSNELIHEALNRRISRCGSMYGDDCSVVRTEGQSATRNYAYDYLYDSLGRTYKYYYDNFRRDGIDGRGGILVGNVRPACGNAYWDGQKRSMNICSDMAHLDIIVHEMTHGVVNAESILVDYSLQSGALNESLSDIFATGVDNNFTMGESLGNIIRSLSNPPSYGDPDRLFSSRYYCGGEDNGGVHINSGVVNKMFYLLHSGGTFNNCTVTGIGDRSYDVVYRALTTYLGPSSNFRSMNAAMQSACADLYDTATCTQVRNALKATEMDQQPEGTQNGAACLGRSRVAPSCTTSVPPTSNPTSRPSSGPTSGPQIPGQPTSTPRPGGSTSTPAPTPPGTTAAPSVSPTLGPTRRPTPTKVQTYTCVDDPKCAGKKDSLQVCPLICTPNSQ
jgi:Zn-dependent metalloprotease